MNFKCDFCGQPSNIITRVALDGDYDRLTFPHRVMYACRECSEKKEAERMGLVRKPKICSPR